MTEMDPAEVLEKAADLYESGQLGWTTGALIKRAEDYNVPVDHACLLGVLGVATNNNPLEVDLYLDSEFLPPIALPSKAFLDARAALADHLRPRMPSSWGRNGETDRDEDARVVYMTNDELVTSQAQAVDLLKHAAKDLRNKKEL